MKERGSAAAEAAGTGAKEGKLHTAGKGFFCMIAACVVYLVWWFVNYYPDSPYSGFIGDPVGMTIWICMFAAVAVLAVRGLVLILRGLLHLPADRSMLKPFAAGVVCVIASVVLPLLISRLRFITLDIFLIIWWPLLELWAADVLYGVHLLERKRAVRSFVRTLLYTGISLFLYIIYPFPPAYVRFVLGAVPIILYAADMTWMTRQMRGSA